MKKSSRTQQHLLYVLAALVLVGAASSSGWLFGVAIPELNTPLVGFAGALVMLLYYEIFRESKSYWKLIKAGCVVGAGAAVIILSSYLLHWLLVPSDYKQVWNYDEIITNNVIGAVITFLIFLGLACFMGVGFWLEGMMFRKKKSKRK